MIPTALTIAGSDPSGGAGIQADLKTFSRLKVFGMSVVTALTAQNTHVYAGSFEVPAAFVVTQIDTVLSDIAVHAVKTGMLAGADIVEAVAHKLREYEVPNLVVDPVLRATAGPSLLQPDAMDVWRRELLPLAYVVTPNIDEAQVLTGREIHTADDMEEAAKHIHDLGPKHVYVKGGHLRGPALDVFFDGNELTRLLAARITSTDTHGTGCVLSAAMTAYLALGKPIAEAVQLSKEFVTSAISNALRIGRGRGPCDPVGIQVQE